jgi:putative two-component system response regulator
VCLWRRSGRDSFGDEYVSTLDLLAKVIGLGLENRTLVAELRRQIRGSLTLLTTLIEDRQGSPLGRSERIAVAVGRRLGIHDQELEDLKLAALVHDLGMLRIGGVTPGAARSFDPEERSRLEEHPRIGAELARSAELGPSVQEAILAHHERLDGSGYPQAAQGRTIPMAARIIAVADDFDVLTHRRPPERPLSQTSALAELRVHAGTRYDAEVVRAFAEVVQQQAHLAALTELFDLPDGTEGVPSAVDADESYADVVAIGNVPVDL